MKIVVIIPTVNPQKGIVYLVDALQERGFDHFLVVDDGSVQDAEPIYDVLLEKGCTILHQGINKGKGAAIKRALGALDFYFPDATGFVTVDGDGQHLPDDVLKVVHTFEQFPTSIILGMRNLGDRGVPLKSRFGNAFSSLYFKFDTGVFCPDTQTGLRCVPIEHTNFAQGVEGNRYEYEMNFLTQAIKSGLSVETVPIQAVYFDGNRQSCFRPLHDSFLIYQSFIRFTLISVSCAVLDLGLFALLTSVLNLNILALVVTGTIVARVSSAALNFLLNRVWSFKSEGILSIQMTRYAKLFVVQMLLSMTLVAALAFLPLPLVLVKALVDCLLFVINYFVQRNWVFCT